MSSVGDISVLMVNLKVNLKVSFFKSFDEGDEQR